MNSNEGSLIQSPGSLFGDEVELITDKISASEISLRNYISTENMIRNCGGVVTASSLPKTNKFNLFDEKDTLFSNIRTYFRKVWLAGFSGGASADVLVFRTKNSSKLDPRFLYYLVSNKEFIDFTDRTSKGVKMPRGDKNAIVKYPLHLPSINEQKAIASVLGVLDDKIENNRQMNETLEEMARAIFKSWFIDFDPVHAKAVGNAPSHIDADTAALFPNSFSNDGLPMGWTNSIIGDEVQIFGGGTPSTKEPIYWEGGEFNWCTPKDLSPLVSPVLLNTSRKITKSGLKKISSGLLPVGTLLLSSRAPVGYLAISQIPVAVNQGFIAMKCTKKLSNLYVLFWCEQNMEKIKNNASGSIFAEITKTNFKPITVICPNAEIISAFDSYIKPIFSKVVSNLKENRTIAELRDTLLPKLISGELQIPDAEREVEGL